MDMVERVARAIWGDLSYRPIGWEAATEAAIRAMLEGLEPVACMHVRNEITTYSCGNIGLGRPYGWTDTFPGDPVYSSRTSGSNPTQPPQP